MRLLASLTDLSYLGAIAILLSILPLGLNGTICIHLATYCVLPLFYLSYRQLQGYSCIPNFSLFTLYET